jgi:hypothetical protein
MLKPRASIRTDTIALIVMAAHAAQWLLSCSGTKRAIVSDFQVEQVPGLPHLLDSRLARPPA